jgi:ABC-type transport system substrate-binding protein
VAPLLCALVLNLSAVFFALDVGAARSPHYGGELRVGVLSLPQDAAPDRPSASSTLLDTLVHDTLVSVEASGAVVPRLATSLHSAANGREWKLGLSPWARFPSGEPVGASDAIRALQRFLRSDSSAAAAFAERLEGGVDYRSGAASNAIGLASPTPGSLQLRLIRPFHHALAPLASAGSAVTDARGRGCGPFIPVLALPGERFDLVGFGQHWRGRPYLTRVRLQRVAPHRAVLGVDDLDIVPGSGTLSRAAQTLLLRLDTTRPPFDSWQARQLVSHSIDRPLLAAHVWPEIIPTTSLLLPETTLQTSAPLETRLSGGLLLEVGSGIPHAAGQRVMAHLSNLGLQVRIGEPGPPHIRLQLWTPEVPERGLAVRELAALAPAPAAAQRAIRASEQSADPSQWSAHLDAALAALEDHASLIALARVPVTFAVRRSVHGAQLDLAGRLLLEDVWVDP